MNISLILVDKKVTPGKALPREAICGGEEFLPESKDWFSWAPAQPDDNIEGHEILVTGLSYGIGNWEYNLSSGYALKARLTSKNVIIPCLRKAKGKETTITKTKEGLANNEYWPILVKIWTDKPNS